MKISILHLTECSIVHKPTGNRSVDLHLIDYSAYLKLLSVDVP